MKSIRSILILFALSFSLFTQSQTGLTNELVWTGGEFSQEFVGGLNSMNDGVHYTSLEESDAVGSKIVKYSYETGSEVAVLATSVDVFGEYSKGIDGYEFSADEKLILITTDVEGIYRYSYKANYYVFNTGTRTTFKITDFEKGKQMLAEFSPDGKQIAFVRDNNLFAMNIESKTETQITTDGKWNSIINGATDWVYEEEFAIAKGYQWSPGSDRIAYYKFDESAVREFSMDMFGELYPEQYKFKYPKAGEKNSVVNIHVWDMKDGKSKAVNTGNDLDQYIPRIKWTQDNNKLCVMSMNRHQNKLEFLLADISKPAPFAIETTTIYSEKADTYIDISDALTFLKDGSFIWLSERDDYNHIYHFDAIGNVNQQITFGPYDVIDFYGYDESSQTAYFSCTATGLASFEQIWAFAEDPMSGLRTPHAGDKREPGYNKYFDPTQKRIYSVKVGKKKNTTCELSRDGGNNDAQFSKGYKYYILTHTDANTPLEQTLWNNSTGKQTRVLKDNAILKERLQKYNLTKKEFFTFQNSSGVDLNCWMMKPTNFDPNKKYPVLVAIYGGPGSNTVSDSWGGRNYLWYQLLCQEGYIVVSCDPRGTQYRGRRLKHSTYMNLGKLETEDFIDFAKHLGNQSYIDKNRIAMQGWSYGGYMTSLCMTKGADYYKVGMAVAPVTNWKYYDTIYTERFLRTPQENSGGYENNSPINFVSALKGKYLLMHGSADDNVHYQNSMDMITALVKAGKQFDMFVYPDKNHGIGGAAYRLHLFTKMTNYLKENL
ncbi:MAG: S9 family peptidase [Flavobacteriales bacterium]